MISSRIMKILDFTEDDLAYNRQGVLSPRQLKCLTDKRRSMKRLLLAIGLLLAGVGGGAMAWQTSVFYSQGNSDWIGLAIGAGVFTLLGLPLIFLGVKPMRPVKVASARGIARLARVQRTSRTNNSTSTSVITELHIAEKIFILPDSTFPDLEDGASYAVYYWDDLNDVFSLERL